MDGLIGALLLIGFLFIMSKQKIQIQDEAIKDMQRKKEDYFSKN